MPASGYRQVVPLAKRPLEYLGFGLAHLAAGQAWKFDTGRAEWTVVILSGSVRAFGPDGELTAGPLGVRKNVFAGKAAALYLPPAFKGRIEAVTAAEVAVCQALVGKSATAGGMVTLLGDHARTQRKEAWSREQRDHATPSCTPIVITPDQVKVKTVGVHNWRREVHDIMDQRTPAARLLVGETFNQTGGWSSYPPHRHDEDRLPLEVNLEEIYFFQVNPPQGFGFQRLYTDDRSLDESYAIENGDTVILPRGYHPVAAAPGYQVYYLWLMAGTGRVMCPFDDPQHAWIKGVETVMREATR
jgi:5-deoxy-glucuronate isomerase